MAGAQSALDDRLRGHWDSHRCPTHHGCKLQGAPWFAKNASCVIMNLNCNHRRLDGTKEELGDILMQLNRNTLFQVIFSHCPKLQIPPEIRSFPWLSGLDFYNDSIDEWSLEAGIIEQDMPFLIYVDMTRTNLSSIPPGLLHHQVPSYLEEVYFLESNFTTLPSNLHEYWPDVTVFGLERCRLDPMPATIAKMKLSCLYITENPFATIEEDLFANENLHVLYVANHPLTTLPHTTTGSMKHLNRLQLQYSNLTEVPLFIRTWYINGLASGQMYDHSLFGTPYCNRTLGDPVEFRYQRHVCNGTLHKHPPYRFNIDQIAAQRPLD